MTRDYVARAGLQHVKGLKKLKRLRIGEMAATETEMKEVLENAKDLEMIETRLGNYTRKGWRDADSFRDKLDKAKKLIEKSKQ